jgi:hypothetical protein
MRKFLKSLPDNILSMIARDFSMGDETRDDKISGLVEIFRSYRLSVTDVQCRYQINYIPRP